MSFVATSRSPRPRRRVAALILAVGTILAFFPGASRAQLITPDETTTVMGHGVYDYFTRDRDPYVTKLLGTVERYHLGESFWQAYREGSFNSVRSDLEFVFAYFPNHPKALHLIAYDPNLNMDRSAVIQHFEAAIRAFPGNAYTYAQYGRYLASIGRKNTGIAVLRQAIRLDPSLVVARAWLEEAEGTPVEPAATPSGGSAGRQNQSPKPGPLSPRSR